MFRKRAITPLVRSVLKTFPALILTGARQTGKTTLLRRLLAKTHRFVLLDEPDKTLFARTDPRGFLEAHPPPVLLDEIQNAPELLPYIKAVIENDRRPGRWVITGSQQFAVMKNVGESLAGRAAVLTLHPFSIAERWGRPAGEKGFHEYLQSLFQPGPSLPAPSLGEWILTGGYPALYNAPPPQRSVWYAGYVRTYLERDVRGNIREANLFDFQRLMKWTAARTGQELNMASASRELGISIPTVKSWISLLTASSLLYLLPPFSRNYGKRVVHTPKAYFLDTGLAAYLVGLQTVPHLLEGPMAGALFETAVVANFKKRLDSYGASDNLHFWRAVAGTEVDLVVDDGGTPVPVEIKLTATVTPRHYACLKEWNKLAGREAPSLFVSRFPETGAVGPGVINRPWHLL